MLCHELQLTGSRTITLRPSGKGQIQGGDFNRTAANRQQVALRDMQHKGLELEISFQLLTEDFRGVTLLLGTDTDTEHRLAVLLEAIHEHTITFFHQLLSQFPGVPLAGKTPQLHHPTLQR